MTFQIDVYFDIYLRQSTHNFYLKVELKTLRKIEKMCAIIRVIIFLNCKLYGIDGGLCFKI